MESCDVEHFLEYLDNTAKDVGSMASYIGTVSRFDIDDSIGVVLAVPIQGSWLMIRGSVCFVCLGTLQEKSTRHNQAFCRVSKFVVIFPRNTMHLVVPPMLRDGCTDTLFRIDKIPISRRKHRTFSSRSCLSDPETVDHLCNLLPPFRHSDHLTKIVSVAF